jgi:hypothetical protein
MELVNPPANGECFKMRSVKLGLLSLGACAPPAISDIATDKVKVQSEIDDPKAATAEAERGCAIYKRVPVPISKRQTRTGPYSYVWEYLYACQDPTDANVIPATAKPGS